MTCTINASVSSSGIVSTADGSGVVKLQSNGVTTNALAWVNFGYVSSAITVRASYNVTSVTRSGVGIYQVNITNALADANYVSIGTASTIGATNSYTMVVTTGSVTTTYGVHTSSAVGINTAAASLASNIDPESVQVAIFGN